MKLQFASVSLLLFFSITHAAACPWKVKEIDVEINKAADRVVAELAVADSKTTEIAAIRHGAIIDCDGTDSQVKLHAFQAATDAFDIEAEVALAATLVECVDEKRTEASKRIDSARASGNRTLERRLLQVSRVIAGYAPRVLDHDVLVNKLASKIERLKLERDQLLKICDQSDF